MNRAPELLAPAGTLRNMRYALAYGADAVYAGMPRYSLRVRNNDFLLDNLATGIREAHDAGRRFFVAANVMPHNSKLATFIEDMRPVVELGPDALIMADP
ncbi:MAG: U32 family peptidase, partial [Gammaproteobacteria bacterium]